MRSARTVTVPVVLVAVAVVACGPPADQRSPADPPATHSTSPSTFRPSRPPKTPTDEIGNVGWIAGLVTRGGSGPCFELQTDDGTTYALHSDTPRTLAEGSRVNVRARPWQQRNACGDHPVLEVLEVRPLR